MPLQPVDFTIFESRLLRCRRGKGQFMSLKVQILSQGAMRVRFYIYLNGLQDV